MLLFTGGFKVWILKVVSEVIILLVEETYLLDVRCNDSFGVKIQSLDTLNVLFLLLTLKQKSKEKTEDNFKMFKS